MPKKQQSGPKSFIENLKIRSIMIDLGRSKVDVARIMPSTYRRMYAMSVPL
jgi:hypothetical protein